MAGTHTGMHTGTCWHARTHLCPQGIADIQALAHCAAAGSGGGAAPLNPQLLTHNAVRVVFGASVPGQSCQGSCACMHVQGSALTVRSQCTQRAQRLFTAGTRNARTRMSA